MPPHGPGPGALVEALVDVLGREPKLAKSARERLCRLHLFCFRFDLGRDVVRLEEGGKGIRRSYGCIVSPLFRRSMNGASLSILAKLDRDDGPESRCRLRCHRSRRSGSVEIIDDKISCKDRGRNIPPGGSSQWLTAPELTALWRCNCTPLRQKKKSWYIQCE